MSRTIFLVPVEGRVRYGLGLEWQRRLASERIDGSLAADVVLLLEHEPVLTLGRGAADPHVVAAPDLLERAGVDRFEVERGGDVTYHGPGQLVGYPILDLRGYRKDLHWYLRTLEEAIITALGVLDAPAFRVPAYTGVWVGDPVRLDEGRDPTAVHGLVPTGRIRKIASIGVHVSRWVTWHGFALNVTEEPLRSFSLIIPCGIDGVRMTSLESEGVEAGAEALRGALATGFARAFGADVRIAAPTRPGERVDLGVPTPP
ncbi:MAG: lipoyl(octanoyl) transferase LipB [Gemmatimonadota bacterium]